MKSSLNPKWESVFFIKQFQRAEMVYDSVSCYRLGCGLANIQRLWSYPITEFVNLIVTVFIGRKMQNTEKTNSILLETCFNAGGVYSLLIFCFIMMIYIYTFFTLSVDCNVADVNLETLGRNTCFRWSHVHSGLVLKVLFLLNSRYILEFVRCSKLVFPKTLFFLHLMEFKY